ncbi:unnamed protein product [Aphanomyces euteiches]
MEVPLFKVHAELNVDLDEATLRLPPILSEPSKLFLPSTKSVVRLKPTATSGAMTARERPKPDLTMRRTKREVFMPVATQSLNHAQHEQLEHILHAFETDAAHHCLRPPDRLFWYFELLDQVAKTASPVQHVLQEIQRVLCDVVYDCAKLDVPRATRGLEFAHLVKQIHHEAIDKELARLEAAMKEQVDHAPWHDLQASMEQTKIQTSRAMELASLEAVLAKAKESQAKLLAEVAAHAESVRRDEELYEHLLGDEVALDRKSSFHRLQLLEAAKMRGQVAEKAHALRDDFGKTMFFLHEKEAQAKEHDAIASTIDDLKREKAHLAAKSEKLTSDIQALEAQLAADQRLVATKREELRLAELDLEEVNESSTDLQRSHTPRPKWDAVFKTLPEVAYVDPVNQAASRDGKLAASAGTNRIFVIIQRQSGRMQLTNESEAARLELSKLQAQVESLARRQRRQVQALPTRGTGLGSLSAVAKTLTAAKKLLGATAGFSNSTEPYTGPVKDYITALGTTPEVPQFLRHTGRVRNRHMTKTELEKIIRTTWSGKRAKEAHMGIKIPLDDYLYEVLKTKFTIQTVIAEWGYNILHSLKAFSWDSEVELFFLCLTGAVSETIYDDQELMLDECRNVLLRLNESYFDAELKHDPKRVYLNDAMLTLHNFFPMKTPLQLKSIERELLREAKSKETSVHGSAGEILIAIDELLPVKHRSSTRGYFLKVLRTQHFKEIQDYLALLDRKIREADVHNIGRVEIQSIKEAMQAIDVAVTDTWLADCILRGIPKRLVGHMGMTTVVEYKTFFKVLHCGAIATYFELLIHIENEPQAHEA